MLSIRYEGSLELFACALSINNRCFVWCLDAFMSLLLLYRLFTSDQTDDMFGLVHLVASNFVMLSKNKKNAILLSLGGDESLTFLLKHQVL